MENIEENDLNRQSYAFFTLFGLYQRDPSNLDAVSSDQKRAGSRNIK
jgi:hypothetical protein